MRRALLLLVSVLVLSACSKSLTRPEAKKRIQNFADFQSCESVPPRDDSFNVALQDRLWQKAPGLLSMGWEPTEKGRQIFKAVTLTSLTLAQPVHRTVSEVTGITDGQQTGTKLVTFTWYLNDLSDAVTRYAGITNADHEGSAEFRLFDDGWRVQDVQFKDPFGGGNPRPLKKLALLEKRGGGFLIYPTGSQGSWHERPTRAKAWWFQADVNEGLFANCKQANGEVKSVHLDEHTLRALDCSQIRNSSPRPVWCCCVS